MKNKLKILMATDYSEAVKSAEHYALQFSKAISASFTIANSYYVPLLADHPTIEEKQLLEDVRKTEDAKMKDHVNKMMQEYKIDVKELDFNYEVLQGVFPDRINEEAKLQQADFLIIGTHGTKGFVKGLFGNHAWKIMKNSEVPVLVVPKDALFIGLKKIVYATEYRSAEIPAIKYLEGIASKFGAELTVLHITDTYFPSEEEITLSRQFYKDVLEETGSNNVKFITLKAEDVSGGLEKYCNEHNTDLLVLSHEKKDLFNRILALEGNIVKTTTFHSKIPVLSIPDYYKTKKSPFWNLVNDVDYDVEYS